MGGRGHRARGRRRPVGRRRLGHHPRACARRGRSRRDHRRCPRRVRGRLLPPGTPGERQVRGEVPAGLGAVAARHREASRRCGAGARRRRRRPRLHRQGERPGALRGLDARARPRPRSAGARPRLGLHPRGLDRLRHPSRDPHQGAQGQPVFDRREPVGPRHRVRRDRGPVGRASERALHAHDRSRPGAARPVGAGHRLRSRRARDARRPGIPAPRARRRGRPARGQLRVGSSRHGREPPRRHQEPRGLRVPRRRSRCSSHTPTWSRSHSSATCCARRHASNPGTPSSSTTGSGSHRFEQRSTPSSSRPRRT